MTKKKKIYTTIFAALGILAIVSGVLALCLCLPKKQTPPTPPPADTNMSTATAQQLVNNICVDLGILSKQSNEDEATQASATALDEYLQDIEEDENVDLPSVINSADMVYCLAFSKGIVDNIHAEDTYYLSSVASGKVTLSNGSTQILPNNLFFSYGIKNNTLTINAIVASASENNAYFVRLEMTHISSTSWELNFLKYNTPSEWDGKETYSSSMAVGNVIFCQAKAANHKLTEVEVSKITAAEGAVEKTGNQINSTEKVGIEMTYLNTTTNKKIFNLRGGAGIPENKPQTLSDKDALAKINSIYVKVAASTTPAFKEMKTKSSNILQNAISVYVDYFSK